jgi:Fms-interacting protein/Thoc5
MKVEDLVQEPYLRSALDATVQARDQSLDLCQSVRERCHDGDQEPISDLQKELTTLRRDLGAKGSHLRGLTRNAIFLVRQSKQETAEARSEIDALHLHLQNLYYEQRHLQGQISDCESYEYASS